MTVKEGDVLADKYRIERLLGEGGMGSVYIAVNTVLQKQVALKVMSERFAKVPAAAERFHREAIAASKVSHPSICQVFDAGRHEGQPWIAMELLDGESLGDRLARGPMSLEEVIHMAEGVLSALADVHEHGIVHRDLKPDNIFLAKDRKRGFVPKVLDFGVAKDTRGEQLSKLTATGAVVGTAYYLSPEQAKGLPDIDARADVYAMGVVLFECLSGRMPYEAETITQLIAKMFTEPPQHLHQVAPEVPHPIADVVTTCLYQDREQRFQTARALLGALEAAAGAIGASDGKRDPALAATGYAMSPTGTAQGVPSAPGLPPGSSPGSAPGSSPGSAPGVAPTAMGNAAAASHAGYAQGHAPQPHTPAPGSIPGTNAPGSVPGVHGPGSAPGHALGSAPGVGTGHGVHPRQVPQTAVLSGAAPGSQVSHAQPAEAERSGSKAGLIALVAVLFLIGAAGTGAAVWLMSEDGGDASDVVATANAGPDVEDPGDETATGPTDPTEPGALDPAEGDPGAADPSSTDPGSTDPGSADPGEGDPSADPEEPSSDDAQAAGSRDDGASSGRRRRRRRRGRRSSSDDTPDPSEPVASPDPDPPRPSDPVRPPRPRPGLTQQQVMTVVNARLRYLNERCYQRVLHRESPNIRGVVTVAWTVQPNGRVGEHRVVHNSTGSDYLARCTDNVVRALRFPASSGPTPARYPFNFRR